MSTVDYDGLAWTRGDVEFVFYVYDDDQEDPRFSFWMYTADGETGMSLFEKPPDGEGKWLCPERKSEYDGTQPTEELRRIMAMLLGDGVEAGGVRQLPAHEEHMFRYIHGTAAENPDALPGPVWAFMQDCEREFSASGRDSEAEQNGGGQ